MTTATKSDFSDQWTELLNLQAKLFLQDDGTFWKDCFPENADQSVLDIGCGDGSFLSSLAKLRPSNNYVGLEPQEALLLTAQDRFLWSPNIKFIQGSIVDMQKKTTELFDRVVVRLVLQHLDSSIPEVLERISPLMRPEGKLIVYEANDEANVIPPSLESLSNLFKGLKAEQAKRGLGREAWKLLLDQCSDSGFQVMSNTSIPHSSLGREQDFFKFIDLLAHIVENSFIGDFCIDDIRRQSLLTKKLQSEVSIATRAIVLKKMN